MSTFELNKIVGAVLLAALVAMVVGMIGDGLVSPRKQTGTAVATGGGAKAPAKEPEKVEPIAVRLAKASPEKGQAAFAPCKACHTTDKDGKNGVGPNLWGVVQQDKGHHQGFSYSAAMKEKEGKWTYEDLDAFIHRPQSFAKGTKMTFAGVPQADKRADIIAYLRSLSDNPAPLPEAKAEGKPEGQGQPAGQK